MSRKKLPIGIQTFSELITEGYYYVDKTPFIAHMVETGKYYFFARPRRFGKSLLVSTLAAAFGGQRELFRGLYLERHWDWSKVYPVIHLSLGRGIVTTRQELDERLSILLTEIAENHGLSLRYRAVADQFSELIRGLQQTRQQPVVILIDEYDKPILDHIERTDVALALREGLKNLYSVIKDCDAHLKFVLLTGVSKFSKVSLFSGLNNLEDISLSPTFATLCGYTEREIRETFSGYLGDVDFASLRDWYNGYDFLGEKVYNPYDVLLFFKNKQYRNYWFETGNPSFLLKLLQERRYYIPQLETLTSYEALLSAFDVDAIELETLLFQTGYLTIQRAMQQGSRQVYQLGYPNLEVKTSMTEFLLRDLTQVAASQQNNLMKLYEILMHGDFDALKTLFEAFFASIPHDWYRKNSLTRYEGYYASIVYCYFVALGFPSIAEDATDHGRIDLTVKLDSYILIFEFKVVERAAGQALAQLRNKQYAQKYMHEGKPIVLLGVEFNAEARNIVGFEWLTLDFVP